MSELQLNPKLRASQNPYLLMPILLLLWGSVAAVSKLLLGQLDSYQLLFYMNGMGVLSFLVLSLFQPGKLKAIAAWTRKQLLLLTACGLFAFLYDFLYLEALTRVPAVEASMLNYLFPIFIVLFAIPLHKERMNRFKFIAVLMGFAGTVLLTTKGDFTSLAFTNITGDLLAVLAAVSWGLFTNLVKLNKQDMLLSTFYITCVAFVLSAGGMLGFSAPALPHIEDIAGVFWLSMCNIVLGFFLYFQALRYSTASLVASFTFFTPFITLLFIVILLGEQLSAIDSVAAVLILSGVPVQRLGQRFNRGTQP
ncbi:EamA domain-containing membrane protein RarD [Paenibacillus taihuensis]|uniref:EamA domain-containing membrane protein RarD n=1 Tax=Paenibacillus taihuensis TaxID=1156355 RepID=A0A3D9Q3T7_9BACL|nr:DMT family transporter [Paenibacillus taihuensis]REE56436.1 EamA domain-containing membrane protein RarD [Paenibacillus taihuensis]